MIRSLLFFSCWVAVALAVVNRHKKVSNLQAEELGSWELLFRQTTPNFMKPASRWLDVNPTKPDGPNYSILKDFGSTCKDAKGKFTFKLKWPMMIAKTKNFNIWKQSTNPAKDHDSKVAGYEEVDINFKDGNWAGLESGYLYGGENPPSLMDGSCGTDAWLYAVGSTDKWQGGIPGPSKKGAAEDVVELYVKCGNAKSERMEMKYDFKDRCNNYKLKRCDHSAAKGDDQVKPYVGTVSDRGVWYFKDKVVYEKDKNTLKVTIRYAHDPRRKTRKRVIMMTRAHVKVQKYLEYDEVTEEIIDDIGHAVKNTYRTFCVNKEPAELPEFLAYAKKLAAEQDKANSGGAFRSSRFRSSRSATAQTAQVAMRGDLQLDKDSRVFHRHVRRHLLGFGHVHINMAQEQHQHLNNLAVEEKEKIVLRQKHGSIQFEVAKTSEVTHGKTLVKNAKHLDSLQDQKQKKSQFTKKESSDILDKFSGGTYLSAKLNPKDLKKPVSAPKSIMKNLVIGTFKETIEWPTNACVKDLANYNVKMRARADLDKDIDPKEPSGACAKCFVPKGKEDCFLQSDVNKPCTNPTCEKNPHSLHCPEDNQCSGHMCITKAEKKKEADKAIQKAKAAKAAKAAKQITGATAKFRSLRNNVVRKIGADQRLTENVAQNTQGVDSENDKAKKCEKTLLKTWKAVSKKVGIDADTWTTSGISPGGTPQCKDMLKQVGILYKDFSDFAKGSDSVLAEVNHAATTVLAGVEDILELTKDLEDLYETMKVINVALIPLQMLPYIGEIIKFLRRALKLVLKVTKTGKNAVKDFQKKLEKSGVEDDLCEMSKRTATLAAGLVKMSKPLNTVVKTAMYVDTVCTGDITTLTKSCGVASTVLTDFNEGVAKLQADAHKAATDIRDIGAVFSVVKKVMENALFKDFIKFCKEMSPVLDPISKVLNHVISVTIPWPIIKTKQLCITLTYPCGVRWCSSHHWWGTINYPCGVNWCTSTGCTTVSYPWLKLKTFSFTINSIIAGAMSLVNIIMYPLNKLIEFVVKALHIDLSALKLPGLPDLPSFGIELDLKKYANDIFAPLEKELPKLDLIPEFATDLIKGTTCQLASHSCPKFFDCEADITCAGFNDVFDKFLPKAYNWKKTEGPVTAVVNASIDLELTPDIQLALSWKEGFAGTFTFPLKLTASFALDISGKINKPETTSNIGDGMTHKQVLPVGDNLLLSFAFGLQPWTKRSLDITADFKASVDIECSTELTFNYEKKRKSKKTAKTPEKPKKPFAFKAPKCTHTVSITATGQGNAVIEVGVDIDVSINNNVGAHITPSIAIELNAGDDKAASANASMVVDTDLQVPDMEKVGADACSKAFQWAAKNIPAKLIPAKTCVLQIAENVACPEMEKLLNVTIPEVPSKTLWEKTWTKADIAKQPKNDDATKDKKKTPEANKYPKK